MAKKEFYYGDWFINKADWIRGHLLNSIGKSLGKKLEYIEDAKEARDKAHEYLLEGLNSEKLIGCQKEDLIFFKNLFETYRNRLPRLSREISKKHQEIHN